MISQTNICYSVMMFKSLFPDDVQVPCALMMFMSLVPWWCSSPFCPDYVKVPCTLMMFKSHVSWWCSSPLCPDDVQVPRALIMMMFVSLLHWWLIVHVLYEYEINNIIIITIVFYTSFYTTITLSYATNTLSRESGTFEPIIKFNLPKPGPQCRALCGVACAL